MGHLVARRLLSHWGVFQALLHSNKSACFPLKSMNVYILGRCATVTVKKKENACSIFGVCLGGLKKKTHLESNGKNVATTQMRFWHNFWVKCPLKTWAAKTHMCFYSGSVWKQPNSTVMMWAALMERWLSKQQRRVQKSGAAVQSASNFSLFT